MDSYFNLFIVIAVYLIAELAKNIMVKTKKEKYRDLIPHVCLIIGAIIALLLLYLYPKALSDSIDDPFKAFICGALSGMAATGSNQLFTRTIKFKNILSNSFGYGDCVEEETYEDEEYVEEAYDNDEYCEEEAYSNEEVIEEDSYNNEENIF